MLLNQIIGNCIDDFFGDWVVLLSLEELSSSSLKEFYNLKFFEDFKDSFKLFNRTYLGVNDE
jgi:hypothetical protein